MQLEALHDLVRAQVQQGTSVNRAALERLSPAQRQAFHTMQRRLRRERSQGRPLAPPVGSALWV